ncbi:MAG: T6SS effector BTH_I2691 family protein, partial [Telluria sp.]
MTQTANTEEKCEFCDKRGLPLLLVRDAITPSDSSAPQSADHPFDLPAHAARFTRRVLRAGFLNVYDEARNRWEAYNVTADGYFFKMPLKPGTIPVKPSKPFNCTDLGHRAVAGCITVPDPSNATKVWIGFSDALWTPSTREKNMAKANREKHMIMIDVAVMLSGGDQKHCRPIAQVSAVVAEFAMSTEKGQQTFGWSFHQFYSRHGRAERLQAECDKLRKGKGQIVTVPDPSGIAAELAQLMKRNVAFFNRDPLRSRLLAADTAIAAVEAGVRDNAILERHRSEQERARNLSMTMSYSADQAKRLKEHTEAALDFTDAERTFAGDKAWKKYAEKFNEKERKAWKEKYTHNLAAYSTKWVDPLAVKHVAIMTSAALVNYFEGNFDARDVDSGAVYTNTVNRCAEGTQDQAACARLYAEWIEGEFQDRKNLLLRALMLNQ